MKIGTETNSLVNAIYSASVVGAPLVNMGDGATLLGWTDRHAATVISVFNRGKAEFVVVQTDFAKVVKGSMQNGSAEYEYERNESGATYIFRKAKSGRWEQVNLNASTGRYIKSGGGYGLYIGKREEYYDPHF